MRNCFWQKNVFWFKLKLNYALVNAVAAGKSHYRRIPWKQMVLTSIFVAVQAIWQRFYLDGYFAFLSRNAVISVDFGPNIMVVFNQEWTRADFFCITFWMGDQMSSCNCMVFHDNVSSASLVHNWTFPWSKTIRSLRRGQSEHKRQFRSFRGSILTIPRNIFAYCIGAKMRHCFPQNQRKRDRCHMIPLSCSQTWNGHRSWRQSL